MNIIVEPLETVGVAVVVGILPILNEKVVRDDLPRVLAKEQLPKIISRRGTAVCGRAVLIIEGIPDKGVIGKSCGFLIAPNGVVRKPFDVCAIVHPPVDLIPKEASLWIFGEVELVERVGNRFVFGLSRAKDIDLLCH